MSAYLYDLTSLTGRKRNTGRTIIVSGFEFGRRALIVTSVALGVSLFPALILSVFFGPLALLITPAIVITAAFVFVEGRTRNGLNVRLYQGILDKKKASTDVFYICFQPIDATLGRADIIASSEPAAAEIAPTAGARYTPATRGRSGSSVSSLLGAAA